MIFTKVWASWLSSQARRHVLGTCCARPLEQFFFLRCETAAQLQTPKNAHEPTNDPFSCLVLSFLVTRLATWTSNVEASSVDNWSLDDDKKLDHGDV